MSNTPLPQINPVRTRLASLADGTVSARTGFSGPPQRLAIKMLPDGAAQAMYDIAAPEQADLTMALTAALTAGNDLQQASNDQTKALGTGVANLVQAERDTLDAVSALNIKIAALNVNMAALIALQTTANAQSAQILTAQQATAATVAAGSNFFTEWTGLTGGQSTVKGPLTADTKIMRVVLSSSTLLGTILGGGAKVYVYYCNGASDAYNASGAVLLGTYPVASNSSYAVVSGRTAPAGKYLRVQASNGGCSVSLDYA